MAEGYTRYHVEVRLGKDNELKLEVRVRDEFGAPQLGHKMQWSGDDRNQGRCLIMPHEIARITGIRFIKWISESGEPFGVDVISEFWILGGIVTSVERRPW